MDVSSIRQNYQNMKTLSKNNESLKIVDVRGMLQIVLISRLILVVTFEHGLYLISSEETRLATSDVQGFKPFSLCKKRGK